MFFHLHKFVETSVVPLLIHSTLLIWVVDPLFITLLPPWQSWTHAHSWYHGAFIYHMDMQACICVIHELGLSFECSFIVCRHADVNSSSNLYILLDLGIPYTSGYFNYYFIDMHSFLMSFSIEKITFGKKSF